MYIDCYAETYSITWRLQEVLEAREAEEDAVVEEEGKLVH